MPSISNKPALRSVADLLHCEAAAKTDETFAQLSKGAQLALPYLFELWAHDHQLPPKGDWYNWVILGGRGAGKTRAGAEWVRAMVEGPCPKDAGRASKVALVGETYDQARDVMVLGPSGILAVSPPDRRPKWHASYRQLVWPNGATAQVFSAQDPEALRGPQFDLAWVDELAKWRKAQDTWDMLQFAVRLGQDPRVCITTTPRRQPLLSNLLEASSTVVTRAKTEANAAYLAKGFLREIRARYAGTQIGRQELDGIILADIEGALWRADELAQISLEKTPVLDRIIVAVDPATTANNRSDECGIIVLGLQTCGAPTDWRAIVLEDRTVQGARPSEWAKAAIKAVHDWNADRLVAEANQGGAMVADVLAQVDPLVPVKLVHASRGKIARSEPVAALYEQGRIFHMRGLDKLEAQMCQMTTHGYQGKGSPDRVDALVWAVHEGLIHAAQQSPATYARALSKT